MTIKNEWELCRNQFTDFVNAYFIEDKELLAESMLYTLRQGKKFRPYLSHATSVALNQSASTSIAYGTAVEMVHAFSLIHDDLPALDNDDYRRGEKTNHKVYGEDVAILSGDALLNEAFLVICKYYGEKPSLCVDLIKTLGEAVGRKGMIQGQILDLKAQKEKVSIEDLKKVHQLKTGCLIQSAIQGAALIAGADNKKQEALRSYGESLGLAFQIADDLLEDHEELGSYVSLLGREEAMKSLQKISEEGFASLNHFGEEAELLRGILQENLQRKF